MQAEVKDAYWKIFDTDDLTTAPGPRLVEIIDARISEMAARYGATYPLAMKCLTTDREGLTAYLRFPAPNSCSAVPPRSTVCAAGCWSRPYASGWPPLLGCAPHGAPS
jgi:hypothetical protein